MPIVVRKGIVYRSGFFTIAFSADVIVAFHCQVLFKTDWGSLFRVAGLDWPPLTIYKNIELHL
jgi:hypothetical protein